MTEVAYEIQVLGWAGVLMAVQLGLLAVAANLQVSTRMLMGPRDEGVRLTGKAGRLQRALANHVEGLVLYAVAAILVWAAGATGPVTAGAAGVYLLARILYVPAYAYGWTPWRSVIWAVGFVATLVVLVAGVLGAT